MQGVKILTVRGEAYELFPKEMGGDRLMKIQSHITPYLCGLQREDFFFVFCSDGCVDTFILICQRARK